MTTRRSFIKQAAAGTALLAFGGALPTFGAKSYANIVGANDKIRVGGVGVNSRGLALVQNFAKQNNCVVNHICDVDSRALANCINSVKTIAGNTPKGEKDVRKMLENKDMDVVIIATPDHWHAPAALMAMQAGKDVYLEKPCSHTPREGEILIEASKKYNRILQMGNQRRSWPNIVAAIQDLKSGIIGEVRFGKGWYTNNRPSIGTGKAVAVPEWLDWDLWQGPAPRTAYKDNVVHYNWHWFWNWGTGEALNNGTHMVDILRWGMDVDYPTQVQSVGGRYYGNDDWETPDTQVITMDFGGKKSLEWEGRSCNGYKIEGAPVGVLFYGSKGTMLITGGNDYTVYDTNNNVIKRVESQIAIDPRNLMNPAELLDTYHIQNLFDAIKKGETLHSDIESGHKSTLLMQLGNISQRVGRGLAVNEKNGRILNDKQAMKYWTRAYEKGWEMKL